MSKTFRFRGVNPDGVSSFGRFVTSDLPAHTEMRYRQGWRSLAICADEGPLPPADGEERLAAIGPDPGTGKRTWWAQDIDCQTMTCRYHGEVPYEHVCQRPGESAMEFAGRVLGERAG